MRPREAGTVSTSSPRHSSSTPRVVAERRRQAERPLRAGDLHLVPAREVEPAVEVAEDVPREAHHAGEADIDTGGAEYLLGVHDLRLAVTSPSQTLTQ